MTSGAMEFIHGIGCPANESREMVAIDRESVYIRCRDDVYRVSSQGVERVVVMEPSDFKIEAVGLDRKGGLWASRPLWPVAYETRFGLGVIRVMRWERSTQEGQMYDRPVNMGVYHSVAMSQVVEVEGGDGVYVYTSEDTQNSTTEWLLGLWYMNEEGRRLVASEGELGKVESGVQGYTRIDGGMNAVYFLYRGRLYRMDVEWGYRPERGAWVVKETPWGYRRYAIDGSWEEDTTAEGGLLSYGMRTGM